MEPLFRFKAKTYNYNFHFFFADESSCVCHIKNNDKEPAAWGKARGLLMFPLGDRNTESVILISQIRP